MKGEGSLARLLIADDHPLAREGLQAMLASEPDLEVIDEATDGEEALELCRRLSPDLVLMDVQMPRMDGLEATRAIKAECPATSILVVTTHESHDYLLEAMKAGAAGYVLKEATKAQLVDAVRKVLSGESPLNPELAIRLLRRLAEKMKKEEELAAPTLGGLPEERPEPLPPGLLTPRELDVLRLLAKGKTNRGITQELHLSLSTVKTHLEHIMVKLEVSDRTQAALKAVELGLRPKREQS
jgi:DNA-binding NarL/FixJ family response regulator